MVATIYVDRYLSNYAVYLDQKYEFETYTLEKAIQIAKLLGATQINVKGEAV